MKAINLIPTEVRRQGSTGSSDGLVYAILGLLAGLVVLGSLWALAHHQIGTRRAAIANANAQAAQVTAEASALQAYTSFGTMSSQRQQSAAQIAAGRFDWAHTMHELGRVLPPKVSLTSFNGSVGSAAPGAAPAASPSGAPGASLTLQGCAPSQSAVALTMARMRLMDGVSDVAVQSTNKLGANSPAGGTTCSGNQTSFSLTVSYGTASGGASTTPSTTPSAAPAAAPAAGSSAPATQTTPASSGGTK
jgi:Tfp pilus assembly protein PilN